MDNRMIAIPTIGTITFSLFSSGSFRRARNIKVVFIDAGQLHWSYEVRDPEVGAGEEPVSGVVVAENIVGAVAEIEKEVKNLYSPPIRKQETTENG